MLLGGVETVGGADDRDHIRASDLVRTVTFGSKADQSEDKEICIREVINAASRAKENGLGCKLGNLPEALPD